MSQKTALTGAEIFDGAQIRQGAALVLARGRVEAIVAQDDIPAGCRHVALTGGMIAPGLVDLQVNGGGGVLLNDAPTPETIATICAAHARSGTTALLPTLITDTPEMTHAAIAAALEAHARAIPGMAGLHLEGPHLSRARKGAHEAGLIRPMEEADCRALEEAARALPALLITVAPESVSPEQVARLSRAGAIVSLGHSDCSHDEAVTLAKHGATCVTHLFNAMSQLRGREPGLVGAALATGGLSAGLIADGFHVDPVAIRLALAAKTGPGRVFLVSDAMATIGTDLRAFTLNARRILREGGRLTLEDGTLAGADIDLLSAVGFMQHTIGLAPEEALRMATLYPARLLGRAGELGTLKPGARADFIWLEENGQLGGVWQEGRAVN